jgi:hypothetical protein
MRLNRAQSDILAAELVERSTELDAKFIILRVSHTLFLPRFYIFLQSAYMQRKFDDYIELCEKTMRRAIDGVDQARLISKKYVLKNNFQNCFFCSYPNRMNVQEFDLYLLALHDAQKTLEKNMDVAKVSSVAIRDCFSRCFLQNIFDEIVMSAGTVNAMLNDDYLPYADLLPIPKLPTMPNIVV